MKQEHQLLWTRLEAFEIDEPNTQFTFSQRLARENGWRIDYAKQVVMEYKKFIFLCCISENGITPSDQVDQAWHLHLTYTKSYWLQLCKNLLNQEIHHNPTQGGDSEKKKFNGFYADTLRLYQDNFGTEPPQTIWPNRAKRFHANQFQRVNKRDFWLFRKFIWNTKLAALMLLIPAALLLVQATDQNTFTLITIVAVAGLFMYLAKKANNNNNQDGSCSAGSASGEGGHHSHGGDDGCSGDGCSGCGGD